VFLGRHTPLLTGLRCVEFLTPGFSDTLQNVCCLTKANFQGFLCGEKFPREKIPKIFDFEILDFQWGVRQSRLSLLDTVGYYILTNFVFKLPKKFG